MDTKKPRKTGWKLVKSMHHKTLEMNKDEIFDSWLKKYHYDVWLSKQTKEVREFIKDGEVVGPDLRKAFK